MRQQYILWMKNDISMTHMNLNYKNVQAILKVNMKICMHVYSDLQNFFR